MTHFFRARVTLLVLTILVLIPVQSRGEETSTALLSSTGSNAYRPPNLGHDEVWKKRWQVSLAPLVASESLDCASSYGMRELNPLLAGQNGDFGGKAVVLKFAITGALIGVQAGMVHRFPRSARWFTILNWTTAGLTAGFAAHNYAIH